MQVTSWVPALKYKKMDWCYYYAYLTLENGTTHHVADIYKALPSEGGVGWVITDWPIRVGNYIGGCMSPRDTQRRKKFAEVKQLLVTRLQSRRKHKYLNPLGY